jgi:putative membrane protein
MKSDSNLGVDESRHALHANKRVLAMVLAGILCAVAVVAYFGADDVFRAVRSVGVAGFVQLCLCALILYLPLGAAWWVLASYHDAARFSTFAAGRIVRDAGGDLLPFSPIGGVVLGARATMLGGMSGSTAFASSTVDVTTELIAQTLFIAIGASIWFAHDRTGDLTMAVGLGVALAIAAAAAFLALQRYGLQWTARLAARWTDGARQRTEAFTQALSSIYRRHWRIAASVVLHLIAWIGSGAITWLAIGLAGGEVDLLSAIAIESLICALRSAAFFVPGALGVQEAGYAFLAPLFGLTPDIGLAVSLLKRAREIVIGVGALLVYQRSEKAALDRMPQTAKDM